MTTQEGITAALKYVQHQIHQTARDKGWWDKDQWSEKRNEAVAIAFVDYIHSELSEVLQALRNGNNLDDKVPEFGKVEIKLADTIIRILDFAEGMDYPVVEALIAKMKSNETHSHKHGGKTL